MKKRSIAVTMAFAVLAIAVLSQLAFAQAPPWSGEYFTDFYQGSGWESVAFAAAFLSIFFAALAYMLGHLFSATTEGATNLVSWSKDELYQAIATLFMLVFIVGVVIYFSELSNMLAGTAMDDYFAGKTFNCGSLPGTREHLCNVLKDDVKPACTSASPPDGHLKCASQIIVYAREASESQIIELYSVYFRLAYAMNIQKRFDITVDPDTMPGFPFLLEGPTAIGIAMTPFAGFAMLKDMFMLLFSTAFVWVMSFAAQGYMIKIIGLMFGPLLTAGIILRTFFFTRKLGGLMMAIALVLYTIWPLMYILVAPQVLALGSRLWVDRFDMRNNMCEDNFFYAPPEENCPIRLNVVSLSELILLTGILSYITIGVLDISFFPAVLQSFASMMAFAVFVPLVVVLTSISAIKGLSGMLGGDTEIAGLTRLI